MKISINAQYGVMNQSCSGSSILENMLPTVVESSVCFKEFTK